MKITYLGTGAAEGVPAMYCKCEVCGEVRRRGQSEYHTRSQIVIDGDLGIDFPPDAYFHSLQSGIKLEDIASPACFEVERTLKKRMKILLCFFLIKRSGNVARSIRHIRVNTP